MTELWRLGARETTQGLLAKQFSAKEVTQSVLARIDAVNPRINALPTLMHEQALAVATVADKARMAAGNDAYALSQLGELHGVPITIKVNVDQAGFATTNGLTALKNNIATENSPLVNHLLQSGAVSVGRSNTPAFSLRWFCDNDAHGRTLNPWDATLTPGGSSGGAAAALACGMGAIAHGNDYGGSIRYPAYACGVVGFRPSVGRVPAYNQTSAQERGISSQIMSVQGPLARNVDDAWLALQIMGQGDARCPIWVPVRWQLPAPKNHMRVALFTGEAAHCAHPTNIAALNLAARALQEAGYKIEPVTPPFFDEACELWRNLVWGDLRRAMPLINQLGDKSVQQNAAYFLDWVPEPTRDEYLAMLDRRLAILRAWTVFFEQYPVLLCPISWGATPNIDSDVQNLDRIIKLTNDQGPMLCTAMLGLPALSVPTGLVNSLPTGVQLVAARFREDLLAKLGVIIQDYCVPQTLADI